MLDIAAAPHHKRPKRVQLKVNYKRLMCKKSQGCLVNNAIFHAQNLLCDLIS